MRPPSDLDVGQTPPPLLRAKTVVAFFSALGLVPDLSGDHGVKHVTTRIPCPLSQPKQHSSPYGVIVLFIEVPPTMASNQENGSHTTANQPLYLEYPVNSSWEISLSTGETVTGTVYCTDEVSNTVFLQKNLSHTTLATELRVLHASQIARSKSVPAGDQSSSSLPMPKVQKKALEEREKRAIRMAEESFRHINEKVRK